MKSEMYALLIEQTPTSSEARSAERQEFALRSTARVARGNVALQAGRIRSAEEQKRREVEVRARVREHASR